MTIESNIELPVEHSISIADGTQSYEDLHQAAYDEGAFYAETDWQWALKEDEEAWPPSMGEHCSTAWAFISGTVCPEWSSERHRLSFFIGYEDRATELANAGEAGYEALAEAGTVADTAGWVLQSGSVASEGQQHREGVTGRSGGMGWGGGVVGEGRGDRQRGGSYAGR